MSGSERGTSAALALFGASSILLAYGFASTRVVEDGLLAAWQPKGVHQFVFFLAAGLGLALAAARLGRTRTPLAALAAAWLVAAHGPGALASAGLIAGAALAIGWRVSRRAAFASGPALEVATLRVAVGLAPIIAIVQVLAHFPVNNPALHRLLLCACLWWGREGVAEAARALAAYCRRPLESRGPLYAHAVLLVVLAAHSAMAAIPEAGSDALAVHLMVPQQVAAHGSWSFDFGAFVWALVPMGADWLYTTANLLGGEAAARLCNFGVLVAVVALVWSRVSRGLGPSLAALFVAGCAAAPIAFLESSSLWVENLLALFLLAGALITARSWTRPPTADVAAGALCIGGALLTKSLAFCGFPLLIALFWSLAASPDSGPVKRLRAGLAAALVLAVGAGPYAYAWAVTGNPLFPFFNDIFKSPYFEGRFVDPRWIGHGGLDVLYQMTFDSSVYGELYDGAFGFHHLLLLPLGIAVAFVRWPRPARVALASMLVVLGLFVAGTQYVRYLYPFLWVAALVEAEALGVLIAVPVLRRAALAVVAFAFLANLSFMPTSFYLLRDFPVDTVFSARERNWFVTTEVPFRRLNEVVNATSGADARVLYVTEPYGAYLEGVPVYGNWHNPAVAARLGAETPEAVARLLADERITHVIIASDQELPVFRAWLADHGRKLWSLWGNELYEIPSSRAAS
jgi:hypothetical protein